MIDEGPGQPAPGSLLSFLRGAQVRGDGAPPVDAASKKRSKTGGRVAGMPDSSISKKLQAVAEHRSVIDNRVRSDHKWNYQVWCVALGGTVWSHQILLMTAPAAFQRCQCGPLV